MANENQSQQGKIQSSGSGHRGFAAMDQEKAREIQSKGGKAVSQDREHMSQIGRIGGEHSHSHDRREENR